MAVQRISAVQAVQATWRAPVVWRPRAGGRSATVTDQQPTTQPAAPVAQIPDELEVPRTRTGSAWFAAAVGAVLVLLMLIFVLQNGDKVQMTFLWVDFTMPLGA